MKRSGGPDETTASNMARIRKGRATEGPPRSRPLVSLCPTLHSAGRSGPRCQHYPSIWVDSHRLHPLSQIGCRHPGSRCFAGQGPLRLGRCVAVMSALQHATTRRGRRVEGSRSQWGRCVTGRKQLLLLLQRDGTGSGWGCQCVRVRDCAWLRANVCVGDGHGKRRDSRMGPKLARKARTHLECPQPQCLTRCCLECCGVVMNAAQESRPPLAPHSLPASCAQLATNACEGAGHRWTAPEPRLNMIASRQQGRSVVLLWPNLIRTQVWWRREEAWNLKQAFDAICTPNGSSTNSTPKQQ